MLPPGLLGLYPDHVSPDMTNSTLINTPFYHKHFTVRVVVGVTCALSMMGALLIILSYVVVKEIRTKARQILVHLSVADFIVACSNFIGAVVYFDQFISQKCHAPTTLNGTDPDAHTCSVLQGLCKTQAFFAAYATLVSVLWTLSLAVYLYCLVVHSAHKVHLKVFYSSYLLCWGIPLIVAVWLIATDRLGYSPEFGAGWCTLKIDTTGPGRSIFVVIFANDLWIYLTFVMVSVLYLTTHCYIKSQMKKANPMLLHGNNMATVSKADMKFLLIPFAFLLLRIWTVITVFVFVYLRATPPKAISYILIYASGIGDSGQGFVNALLFCVFTPKVRTRLMATLRSPSSFLCCCCCCCCRREPSNHSEEEDTKLLSQVHLHGSSSGLPYRARSKALTISDDSQKIQEN